MAVPASSLQELKDYTAYVKTLMCDASGCWTKEPEPIATYPPTPRKKGMASKESASGLSNARYTRPRAEVDAEIARFLARQFEPKQASGSLKKRRPQQ